MNNILVGANGVEALRNAPLEELGLDSSNTRIIYRINPLGSWMPGRAFNTLNEIVRGESYYLVSKTEHDQSINFSSPLNRNMESYSFESQGILASNSPAQNRTAMQDAINRMTSSAERVKTLYGRDNYPIMGPITVEKDVVIKGNSTGFKGSPNTATFVITDTENSVFFMRSRSSLDGWNFDYPNNNHLTTPSTHC